MTEDLRWCGKPIEELTIEELRSALIQSQRLYRDRVRTDEKIEELMAGMRKRGSL